jgi:hypothetical protein
LQSPLPPFSCRSHCLAVFRMNPGPAWRNTGRSGCRCPCTAPGDALNVVGNRGCRNAKASRPGKCLQTGRYLRRARTHHACRHSGSGVLHCGRMIFAARREPAYRAPLPARGNPGIVLPFGIHRVPVYMPGSFARGYCPAGQYKRRAGQVRGVFFTF